MLDGKRFVRVHETRRRMQEFWFKARDLIHSVKHVYWYLLMEIQDGNFFSEKHSHTRKQSRETEVDRKIDSCQ